MKLRYYQEEAIQKTYDYLRNNPVGMNPCIVLPTGSGKTPVIASICEDSIRWKRRVLIIAHRKELLEQSYNHLSNNLKGKVGIYSAGLKKRDTGNDIIIGGIQSIYRRAAELGVFDVVIVDEAHLIPAKGLGMYRQFIKELHIVNNKCRIIGLTATPYRLDSGPVCGKDTILTEISHESDVPTLIDEGYLCPLISKAGIGKARANVDALHKRGGEFVESEVQHMMDDEGMVTSAVSNIKLLTKGRNKVLIFAAGVEHGKHVAESLRTRNRYTDEGVEEVYGETLFRDEAITRFKQDENIKFMVNCDVLTIGFDYPAIDCVVLLRPTCSPGYYYQMCGRGLRTHESKFECLILDYGENILRHGPIDKIKPVSMGEKDGDGVAPSKECPACSSVIMASNTVCPDCGWEFTREVSHETEADEDTPIIGGITTHKDAQILGTTYHVHVKDKGKGDISTTMRVEYRESFNIYHKEWICIEHLGWARTGAERWWGMRSNVPCPTSIWEAVALANDGALCETLSVKIKSVSGEKYTSISDYTLGDIPEYQIELAETDESKLFGGV